MYISTKTFGHEFGLSTCFRQWRAQSHCRLLHGYALAIKLEFEADELDERNWVVDFGSFGYLKSWLQRTFDHTMLVAEDDPERTLLTGLHESSVANIVFVPATGCEAFAKLVYEETERWLLGRSMTPRCRLRSVEVREHGANSAIYTGENA